MGKAGRKLPAYLSVSIGPPSVALTSPLEFRYDSQSNRIHEMTMHVKGFGSLADSGPTWMKAAHPREAKRVA